MGFQAGVSAFIAVGVVGILIVALVGLSSKKPPSEKEHEERRGLAGLMLFVALLGGLILLLTLWPFWVCVGLAVVALLFVILTCVVHLSDRKET